MSDSRMVPEELAEFTSRVAPSRVARPESSKGVLTRLFLRYARPSKTQGALPRTSHPSILAFATQGAGGDDEARLLTLLDNFDPIVFAFDRKGKWWSFRALVKALLKCRPHLVVMEGTGIAGGLAILLARLVAGIPYVVSSGDAVGPFVGRHRPLLGPLFGLYERLLCRLSAGYIGWTPYLAGRALTFGAPRVMSAPGWAPCSTSANQFADSRVRIRKELGIAPEDLVFGIVGSLAWTRRVRYCYGLELVRALGRTKRRDLKVIIVGDGDGRPHLEQAAGKELGVRVFLTGRVPREQVPEYLSAMDVASLPQSVDQVGSFRYTTKLSEYLAAGLPVVTGQIPLAYDLGDDWLWRLPGNAPWDERYLQALANLMEHVSSSELTAKQEAVPDHLPEFDRSRQVDRVTAFLMDLLPSGEQS